MISRDRSPIVIFAVALLAVFGAYGWTLDGYFQGDDFGFIGRYHDYPWSAWPGLFTHAWADGLWTVDLREIRPLNALAFMVDARLWGAHPMGYRLTNLLLHAGSAGLVGLLAGRVCRGDRICALVATLLFALHPAQPSAVAWITGRVDLLSTFFYLGAFLAFVRFRQAERRDSVALAGLAVGLAGALFTKESGMTFPAMMLAADFLWLGAARRWRQAETWLPYLVGSVVVGAYLLCRHAAFGIAGPGGIGNGLPDVTPARFLPALALRQAGYVARLFIPPARRWLLDWHASGLPLTSAHLLRAGLLALAMVLAAVAARRAFRRETARPDLGACLFFGAAWYLITTLPLMVTYFSARHLYPACAGLAVAVPLALRHILPHPTVRVAAFSVLVGLAAWLHQAALRPWHDAGRLSGAIAHEIDSLAPKLAPGDALFLDVPDLPQNAFCWSWAVPYALRPPFRPQALDRDLVLLERPAAYARVESWHRQPAFTALPEFAHTGWLVQARGDGNVRHVRLSAECVRRAALALEPARSGTGLPAWEEFVSQLEGN